MMVSKPRQLSIDEFFPNSVRVRDVYQNGKVTYVEVDKFREVK